MLFIRCLLRSSTAVTVSNDQRHFAKCSVSQLREELKRSSRKEDRTNVIALIDEIIARQEATKLSLLSDACFIAYQHQLYDRCVELFFSCTTLPRVENLYLHPAVLDSASHLKSVDTLLRGATCIVPWIKVPTNALACMRAVWLCAVRFRELRHHQKDPSAVNEAAQCERAAREVYEIVLNSGVFGRLDSFEVVWNRAFRCVLYATQDDNGEAVFYEYLHDQYLKCGAHAADMSVAVALLRSTERSLRTDIAMEYYESYAHIQRQGLVEFRQFEIVAHQYLSLLSSVRMFQPLVKEARDFLLVKKHKPRSALLSVMAKAAGEARDVTLAVECVNRMLQLGATSQELMVGLTSLAKCSAPNLNEIVDECIKHGALANPNPDDLFQLQLHAARKSHNPTQRLHPLLPQIDKAAPRTAIIALRILVDTDDRDFLPLFWKFAPVEHGALSKTFGETLLAWAAPRTQQLSEDDARAIQLFLRRHGLLDVKAAESYRAHLDTFLARFSQRPEPVSSPGLTRRRHLAIDPQSCRCPVHQLTNSRGNPRSFQPIQTNGNSTSYVLSMYVRDVLQHSIVNARQL